MKRSIILSLMVAALATAAQAGLLAEFTFDTDTTDTAGGYDGILGGGATVSGGVLILDNGGFMDLAASFSAVNPFDGSGDYSIVMDYKQGATRNTLISSARPGLTNDAVGQATHSMAVYTWPRRADDRRVAADNWYVNAATSLSRPVSLGDVDPFDGQWHTVVVTYDASETLMTITTNGVTGERLMDPAIPDIHLDTVRIGGSLNTFYPLVDPANILTVDNVRIYNEIIPEPTTIFLLGLGGLVLRIRRK